MLSSSCSGSLIFFVLFSVFSVLPLQKMGTGSGTMFLTTCATATNCLENIMDRRRKHRVHFLKFPPFSERPLSWKINRSRVAICLWACSLVAEAPTPFVFTYVSSLGGPCLARGSQQEPEFPLLLRARGDLLQQMLVVQRAMYLEGFLAKQTKKK